ncbi:MAG: RHS repeat-associated core domain-containing protein, partial [Bacteroidales bacterium]|nr:RHS repeat-associated core domain-containing protein [Bacteroidales bacterium]
FHDPELDLVYYNYRHYSPPLGRFLSRAPIEEQGGLNLYAFVKNQTAFETDILGRKGNWKSSGEVYNIECKITEAKPHVMHGSTGADGLLDKIYVTWEITGEVMCTCGDDEKFVKVKKSAIMGNEPITPIYVYKPMDNTPGTAISLWELASTLLANLIESQLDSFFAFYFVNSKNDRSVIKRLIIKSINNKPDFKHELLGDDPCESLN